MKLKSQKIVEERETERYIKKFLCYLAKFKICVIYTTLKSYASQIQPNTLYNFNTRFIYNLIESLSLNYVNLFI